MYTDGYWGGGGGKRAPSFYFVECSTFPLLWQSAPFFEFLDLPLAEYLKCMFYLFLSKMVAPIVSQKFNEANYYNTKYKFKSCYYILCMWGDGCPCSEAQRHIALVHVCSLYICVYGRDYMYMYVMTSIHNGFFSFSFSTTLLETRVLEIECHLECVWYLLVWLAACNSPPRCITRTLWMETMQRSPQVPTLNQCQWLWSLTNSASKSQQFHCLPTG